MRKKTSPSHLLFQIIIICIVCTWWWWVVWGFSMGDWLYRQTSRSSFPSQTFIKTRLRDMILIVFWYNFYFNSLSDFHIKKMNDNDNNELYTLTSIEKLECLSLSSPTVTGSSLLPAAAQKVDRHLWTWSSWKANYKRKKMKVEVVIANFQIKFELISTPS